VEIRIQLPHVYSPGSDPADRQAATSVIHDVARTLKLRRGFFPGRACYFRDDTCAVLSLENVFEAQSDALRNSQVLTVLLDGMIRLNRAYLRRHAVPPLYESGVTYQRTTDWLPIPALYACQFGDCKSLGPARAAELLEHGQPARPVHRWYGRKDESGNDTGIRDYHVLIMRPGAWECPSRQLGMGANDGFRR